MAETSTSLPSGCDFFNPNTGLKSKLHPHFQRMWCQMLAGEGDKTFVRAPWVSGIDTGTATFEAKWAASGGEGYIGEVPTTSPLYDDLQNLSIATVTGLKPKIDKYGRLFEQFSAYYNAKTGQPTPSPDWDWSVSKQVPALVRMAKPNVASKGEPLAVRPFIYSIPKKNAAFLHPISGTCVSVDNPFTSTSSTDNAERALMMTMIQPMIGQGDSPPVGTGKGVTSKQNYTSFYIWDTVDECNDWLTSEGLTPFKDACNSPPDSASREDKQNICWSTNRAPDPRNPSTGSFEDPPGPSGYSSWCRTPFNLSSKNCSSESTCSLWAGGAYPNAVKNSENGCSIVCTDTSCPKNQYCDHGVCSNGCNNDTDCDAGKICSHTNQCIDNPTQPPTPPNPTCNTSTCPTHAGSCDSITGDCSCGVNPACDYKNYNFCVNGTCVCGKGAGCTGSSPDCLFNPISKSEQCGVCSTTCKDGNQCTTDGKCTCGTTGKPCTNGQHCSNGKCVGKKSSSHTPLWIGLGVAIGVIVILSLVLGIYFGLKHKHSMASKNKITAF